jgi:hypothetical protein
MERGHRGAAPAPGIIGRDAVLATLMQLLAVDSPSAAFVHGPAGIGKSALLRATGERFAAAGRPTAVVDGRDRDLAADRLADALAALAPDGLLLFDTFELAPALGNALREALRAGGPRMVIASRRPPDPQWLDLRPQVLTLRLSALDRTAAQTLVVSRGLQDSAARERVVDWAAGSPLALTAATDMLLAGRTVDLDRHDADALLASLLLQRFAGDELSGEDSEVLAVAAIARGVDARLLAGVLPGVDGDHAEGWLRSLSFAEPLGLRVALHDRVRRALRGALLEQDPEHERELRRRIADHLHARAVLGEPRLWTDLAELVDDETVRWGIAPPPITHRADVVRAGDEETIEAALDLGDSAWWRGVRRWFADAREQVTIVRGADGAVAGAGIWVTPARAPAWVAEDPILGPWLVDARTRAPDGNALLLRDAFDLETGGDMGSPVVAVGNHAVVLRSGLANPRYLYAGVAPGDEAMSAFLTSIGHQHVERLDVRDGERTVCCYISDVGPGGVMGLVRDTVYRELGLQPPTDQAARVVASDTVRDALRCFHQPAALATSPLARGGTVEDRASSVRRVLREAVAATFGNSHDERLQRAVLERGYLDADGGPAVAQRELHLGRTTYFRRLADASERVSDYVLERSR